MAVGRVGGKLKWLKDKKFKSCSLNMETYTFIFKDSKKHTNIQRFKNKNIYISYCLLVYRQLRRDRKYG